MKIRPVKNKLKPKYPDKYEIELNKALLYFKPKSWLGKPIIGLSLTALLAAGVNIGCIPPDPGHLPPPDYINVSDIDALRIITEELTKADYHDPWYTAYQLKETYPDAVFLNNPEPWGNPEDDIRKQVRDFLEWLQSIDLDS